MSDCWSFINDFYLTGPSNNFPTCDLPTVSDPTWKTGGGRTVVSLCPGHPTVVVLQPPGPVGTYQIGPEINHFVPRYHFLVNTAGALHPTSHWKLISYIFIWHLLFSYTHWAQKQWACPYFLEGVNCQTSPWSLGQNVRGCKFWPSFGHLTMNPWYVSSNFGHFKAYQFRIANFGALELGQDGDTRWRSKLVSTELLTQTHLWSLSICTLKIGQAYWSTPETI